jgi:hypothetical protein
VAAPRQSEAPPEAFRHALGQFNGARLRPEVVCEPMPAPQRIAPYSAALSADVVVDGRDVGAGRLVLLHDPAGNDTWDGTFRCVAYARAEIEPEMVTDSLLAAVGWSWLIDALVAHQAGYVAAQRHGHHRGLRELRRNERGARRRRDRGPRFVDAYQRPERSRRGMGRAALRDVRPARPVPSGVVALPVRRRRR